MKCSDLSYCNTRISPLGINKGLSLSFFNSVPSTFSSIFTPVYIFKPRPASQQTTTTTPTTKTSKTISASICPVTSTFSNSILLSNVPALDNKLDGLHARVSFQRVIRNCNILCFTELR